MFFEIILITFALISAAATYVGAQKNSPTQERRTQKNRLAHECKSENY